jgi:hypothetical protein
MSRKRGRLRREDELKIQLNWVYLMDIFDPRDDVLDLMYNWAVFDQHDKDHVLNGGPNTAKGRSERFLGTLKDCGELSDTVAKLKVNLMRLRPMCLVS